MREVSCFDDWLTREMPAGTVIGDPLWWAPRIRKALAAEDADLRALLAECGEQVFANRKRLELDIANAAKFPTHTATVRACTVERDVCDALLDRIDAAVQEVKK